MCLLQLNLFTRRLHIFFVCSHYHLLSYFTAHHRLSCSKSTFKLLTILYNFVEIVGGGAKWCNGYQLGCTIRGLVCEFRSRLYDLDAYNFQRWTCVKTRIHLFFTPISPIAIHVNNTFSLPYQCSRSFFAFRTNTHWLNASCLEMIYWRQKWKQLRNVSAT